MKKSVSGTPVTAVVSKRQSGCLGIFSSLEIKESNLPWKFMRVCELKGFEIAQEEQMTVDTISIVTQELKIIIQKGYVFILMLPINHMGEYICKPLCIVKITNTFLLYYD